MTLPFKFSIIFMEETSKPPSQWTIITFRPTTNLTMMELILSLLKAIFTFLANARMVNAACMWPSMAASKAIIQSEINTCATVAIMKSQRLTIS